MLHPIPTCPSRCPSSFVHPAPPYKITNVNVNVNVNKFKGSGTPNVVAPAVEEIDRAELEEAVSGAIRSAIDGAPA